MQPLYIQSVGCHASPIVKYFSSNCLQFFISIICGTWWIRRKSLVFVNVIFKCTASALLNSIFPFKTHFQWKGRDWACVDNPSKGVVKALDWVWCFQYQYTFHARTWLQEQHQTNVIKTSGDLRQSSVHCRKYSPTSKQCWKILRYLGNRKQTV